MVECRESKIFRVPRVKNISGYYTVVEYGSHARLREHSRSENEREIGAHFPGWSKNQQVSFLTHDKCALKQFVIILGMKMDCHISCDKKQHTYIPGVPRTVT